ncbi:hydrogenase maturation protease [Archaeoglobus sp.]
MKIVVVGIGNVLMRDDGFGVKVVEKLKKMNLPATIYELGTLGLQILNYIEGYDLCIIVDVIKGDGKPGDIYVFDFDDVYFKTKNPISLHDIGLIEALKFCGFNYRLPKIKFVGVEPEVIEFGIGLSKPVEKAVPKAIKIVKRLIEEAMMNTPAPET